MVWDPDEWEPGEPPPKPRTVVAILCVLMAALLLFAVWALLSPGDAHASAPVPFAVVLPDGTETIACAITYTLPPAKLVELHPCVDIFANGFEP